MTNQQFDNNMLLPLPWIGYPSQCRIDSMEWVKNLPDSTYLSLFLRWPTQDLPLDHKSYIVGFHLEAVDTAWVDRQASRITNPIVVLHDGSYYDWPHAPNVIPVTYMTWHTQIAKMLDWYRSIQCTIQPKKFKASTFCNRITQSKLLIFTALAEYVGIDDCVLTLSDWLEEKNVHHKQPTGRDSLDNMMQIFFEKYFGKTIRHDNFDNSKNFQRHTSDWSHPAYQSTALHFAGESFHYSLMGDHIYPGPLICEKTFKPILAAQPFVPVGQFDIYGSLSRLGFRFDYGFDTSWDDDPGNLSRLESIVGLIKGLKNISIQDIVSSSKDSCQHNLDHVLSGDFAKVCQNINDRSIQKVLSIV